MSYSDELYQRTILEHNKSPKNFCQIPDFTHTCKGRNPLCGDHVQVFIKTDFNQKIEDVSFTGSGCAISQASSSMMTEFAKGKTIESLKNTFKLFSEMTKGELSPQENLQELGKLILFQGVQKFSARVKCANLPWHTLLGAFEQNQTVTTEVESAPSNSEVQTTDKKLDLTGVKCPINFVKAKIKLSEMPLNSKLELILDDGDPIVNVPESLAMDGQKIISNQPYQNQHRVVVLKLK